MTDAQFRQIRREDRAVYNVIISTTVGSRIHRNFSTVEDALQFVINIRRSGGYDGTIITVQVINNKV